MSKVWFITGAGSGLGTGIAKAALRAGDRVVATGRNLEKVRNVYPDVAQENIAFVQVFRCRSRPKWRSSALRSPWSLLDRYGIAQAGIEESCARVDMSCAPASFTAIATHRHAHQSTNLRENRRRRGAGRAGAASGAARSPLNQQKGLQHGNHPQVAHSPPAKAWRVIGLVEGFHPASHR
jgi:hypothetical protein